MQAHFKIMLPFDILIAVETPYAPYEIHRDGYRIVHDLPSLSDERRARGGVGGYVMDGRPAVQMDTLNIRVFADRFDRTLNAPLDPTAEVVELQIATFLERLRYLTLAPQIRVLKLNQCSWDVEYLEDDGASFDSQPNMLRGHGGRNASFSFIGCRPAIWDAAFQLPENFQPPVWHTLLVDAWGTLPHVGAAIALAATALEVFIADVLDGLANRDNMIHPQLWLWVCDRGFHLKNPSNEEQFDGLLLLLCGHSLQETESLWKAFKEISQARNNFVHQGSATLGKSHQVVDLSKAQQLIGKAREITLQIRDWLPPAMQWPIQTEPFEVQVLIAIPKSGGGGNVEQNPNDGAAT